MLQIPDEKISNPATGAAPDLLAGPVESTSSSATDDAGSVASDLPKLAANPSVMTIAAVHQVLQVDPHIRVRWHAEAFIDGKGVYKGFVKGISLTGTSIYLGLNLQKVKSVKLRIHVPLPGSLSVHRVMEVAASVIYSSYDGYESLFHTGLTFTQFNLASDQSYLQARIASLKE